MNRRQFVQTGSQVVTGMLLIKANTAFGYQANSAVRHGLLGCGNRGTSVATSFSQNTSAQVDQKVRGLIHLMLTSSDYHLC